MFAPSRFLHENFRPLMMSSAKWLRGSSSVPRYWSELGMGSQTGRIQVSPVGRCWQVPPTYHIHAPDPPNRGAFREQPGTGRRTEYFSTAEATHISPCSPCTKYIHIHMLGDFTTSACCFLELLPRYWGDSEQLIAPASFPNFWCRGRSGFSGS